MKMKFFAVLGCVVQMAMVGIADEPKSATCRCACPCSSSVDKGIVAAVDDLLKDHFFIHKADLPISDDGLSFLS